MKRRPKHHNSAGGKRSPESEDQIVQRLRRAGSPRNRAARLRLGIGDDAALFAPRAGFETVLTCDWFLEGTHFLRDKHPADAIGWKCLARAISDIAAMGGTPRCFLLSLALPATHTGTWLDGFLAGLRRAQQHLSCVLAGGDTTKSNRILIQVTVVGEVRGGDAILRSGARPGDAIFVSGRLGEAELGLCRLRSHERIDPAGPLLRKHLYPEPRLRLGSWLAKKKLATAMMDLSDGLSTDLARLCAASGVGARVEVGRLPLPTKVGNRVILRELALHGGDDYELLFTVSRKKLQRIPKSLGTLPLTPIGTITRATAVCTVDAKGNERPLTGAGWDPFRLDRPRD